MTRRALLALALALALAPVASAHATLQSAEPPPNGHAAYGTTVVNLTFTEDVEPQYTAVTVEDTYTGTVVNDGPLQFDASHHNVVHQPVKPLGDSLYTIAWQTLSVDTHTARGTYVISAGSQTIKVAIPPEVDHNHASTLPDGVAHAVFYGGLFLALGLPVFAVLVDGPAIADVSARRAAARHASDDPRSDHPIPRRLFVGGAVFAALAAGGAALSFVYFQQNAGFGLALAAQTLPGRLILARASLVALAALALAAGALAPPARARRAWGWVAIALAGGALVATALGSHAAADLQERGVSTTLDSVHLLMGALWIGGVFGFVLVGRDRGTEELGAMVARFSPLALAAVALLLITGTYASLRHIPRVSDLWNDGYGRLVSLKVLLLVPLIFIGYLNKDVIGPRLISGAGGSRFFRRAVTVEALVMVCILAAAGILAASAPPDQEVAQGDRGIAPQLEFEMVMKTQHVVIDVLPNPVTAGALQRVAVTLHPLSSAPVPASADVGVKVLAPGDKEANVQLTDVERIAQNAWSTNETALFTSPGNWTLVVIVQVPTPDGGTDYLKQSFPVPVVAPTKPGG